MLEIETGYDDMSSVQNYDDYHQNSPKKIPIVGYTGSNINMLDAKIGRSVVHKTSIAEKEVDDDSVVDQLYFKNVRPNSRSNTNSPQGSPCSTSSNVSMFSQSKGGTRERTRSLLEQKLYEDRSKELSPILGYQGMYLGKVEGKIGKTEIHKGSSIGKWEEKNEGNPFFTITETDPLPRKGMEGETKIAPDSVNNTRLYPITGYTGSYRGKVVGNLGRADRHAAPLSSFDGQTVTDIIGDGEGRLKYSGTDKLA